MGTAQRRGTWPQPEAEKLEQEPQWENPERGKRANGMTKAGDVTKAADATKAYRSRHGVVDMMENKVELFKGKRQACCLPLH